MSAQNKINFHSENPSFVLPQTELARCAIDETGIIVYANDAFLQLTDIENTQNSSHIFDLFTFSDELMNENDAFNALPSGEHDVHIKGNPIISEFYFDWLSTPDGRKYLIASATGEALETNYDSDIDNLLGRIHDSTSRIHSNAVPIQQKEQPTEHDLEVFVKMSHDIMLICDEQGQIITANTTFIETFGYDEQTCTRINFLDLLCEEDKHLAHHSIQSLSRDPDYKAQTIDLEARTYTRKGEERWVEWRKKCEGGKIYAAGRDITDIKKQEQNLNRRQRQLSEAEAIGRMGHWHWLIGEDNISWSEEIYRIFGVDQTHFTPNLNTLTDLIHKRDLGRVVQVFQRAIIEEKNYDMEFRILRPGGDVRYIMCEGRCEKDDEGEVIALYGIMQDMTERMLYEEELRQAKDASEQAYAAKSQFLANMSHELRTPLNAVIGFSEMIESQMLGPIFNEKYLEYAGSIKESGQHLLDLISDILDMSKIEAGKHTLDLEEVNIKDIIQRTTHMVQTRAQEGQVQLRMSDIENSDISITADRRALTQIFLNLLSNAIKFTPPHGSVWFECYPRDEHLSIRLCDTGIGIPPNKLAAVLKPFEQASSHYTRDHEGTGLGLSITKELIELHGGTLLIDSTVDIGTNVTVRLPYNPQKD